MFISAGDWLHLNKKQRNIMLEKLASKQVLANKKAA
jgi:hypothetical protein